MAKRHQEFLDLGARVFALSADTPPMNSAVMENLALPFPILSDPDRDKAITPLGFADEKDPRQISRAGTVILAPGGEIVFTVTGRDYADRPDEDMLLKRLAEVGLDATTQEAPTVGPSEPGPTAAAFEGLTYYLKGAKFAALAIRSRYRDFGVDFRDDTKNYVKMTERYLDALTEVESRRS